MFKPTYLLKSKILYLPQLWPRESVTDHGSFSTEKNKEILTQSLQKKGMLFKGSGRGDATSKSLVEERRVTGHSVQMGNTENESEQSRHQCWHHQRDFWDGEEILRKLHYPLKKWGSCRAKQQAQTFP